MAAAQVIKSYTCGICYGFSDPSLTALVNHVRVAHGKAVEKPARVPDTSTGHL